MWARFTAVTGLVLAGVLALPGVAMAKPKDLDIPVGTWLAARTHPAVQLTSVSYTADVAVPTPVANLEAIRGLTQQGVAAVQSGKISSDENSIYRWVVQQMAKEPGRYFSPGAPERVVEATAGGLCTGWWVTPDGYMVTAAHCVGQEEDELAQTFATQALTKINEKDAADLISSLGDIASDDEIVRTAAKIFQIWNADNIKIRNVQSSLSLLQSLPGGGVDKTAKAVPIELVAKGTVYPGKDIAILKANGQNNLPTVPLGQDSDVRVGDTLYISGFPGTVTQTSIFNIESKLDPAFTEGPYNASRQTPEGVPYIQTQAPSYPGNSGGPVFSKDGNVIGILVGGLIQQDGGSTEGESFVLPVSIVREKLNEKNIKSAESVTTKAYNEALDLFFKNHYSDALPKFREVQALQPNHPYVAKYITDSQQAITAGKDESSSSILPWVLWGGGGLLVLFVLGTLGTVLRGKRRSKIPPSSFPPAPYGAQPGYLPPGQGQYGHPAQHGQPYGVPQQQPYPQRPPYPLPAAPEDTRAVRPHSPYGEPQQKPGPGANTRIAGLEAELEQLRRNMGQRPPDQR
ncbi:Trypsin-like peptidase domain-containing protein [Streptosporangium canum]|uniref:Trypsin-like peptidase domain-containing protein n=1 Tax=Streptosporangium canum TaxID=324952 RepID=A0A1I3U4H1_9ACTN|nr:serine protease [Streptosporangium canum]SFJ76776.1 Trypsin-like peptidase domain-containing protein [Streptosporangium canum]